MLVPCGLEEGFLGMLESQDSQGLWDDLRGPPPVSDSQDQIQDDLVDIIMADLFSDDGSSQVLDLTLEEQKAATEELPLVDNFVENICNLQKVNQPVFVQPVVNANTVTSGVHIKPIIQPQIGCFKVQSVLPSKIVQQPSPSSSKTGSCETKQPLDIKVVDKKINDSHLDLPQILNYQVYKLPAVSKPNEVQKRPGDQGGKRKKPDVDLSAISDVEELRRQKRLMKNRRTAANSRAKKKQELEGLQEQLESTINLHNDKVELIEQLQMYCVQLQQKYEKQNQTIEEYKKQYQQKDQELQAAQNLLASHGIDVSCEEAGCQLLQQQQQQQYQQQQQQQEQLSPAGSVDGSA